jgi:hypothetical protein
LSAKLPFTGPPLRGDEVVRVLRLKAWEGYRLEVAPKGLFLYRPNEESPAIVLDAPGRLKMRFRRWREPWRRMEQVATRIFENAARKRKN